MPTEGTAQLDLSSPPSTDGLECAACSYDLSFIADGGRCPECGLARRESVATLRAWSVPRLRAAWLMLITMAAVAIIGVVGLSAQSVLLIRGERELVDLCARYFGPTHHALVVLGATFAGAVLLLGGRRAGRWRTPLLLILNALAIVALTILLVAAAILRRAVSERIAAVRDSRDDQRMSSLRRVRGSGRVKR